MAALSFAALLLATYARAQLTFDNPIIVHGADPSVIFVNGTYYSVQSRCAHSCLGIGREPVVCLVGDGAALYSPQALWTLAHERLPVTVVVMNNREYNVLKNFMKGQAHYLSSASNRFIAMDLVEPAINYLALAASMGVVGRRIERAGDIAPAVKAGIVSGQPNLIEVMISAT